MTSPLKRLNRLRKYQDGDISEWLKTEMRQNLKSIEDTFSDVLGGDKFYYNKAIPTEVNPIISVSDTNIPILPLVTKIFETEPLDLKPDTEYLVNLQPTPSSITEVYYLGFINGSRRGVLHVSNSYQTAAAMLPESSTLQYLSRGLSFILKTDPNLSGTDTFKIEIGKFNAGVASTFGMTIHNLIIREL